MNRYVLGVLAAAAVGVSGASSLGQNVVISQVYGGGGATTGTPTYTHDYVELLNTGPAAVDINGWSLQYAAATGSSWSGTGTTVLATTSTILQPGQYFLVRLGTATGAIGGTIPVAQDATGTTAMSATTGKIALVSNSTALAGTCPVGGAIVDFIGYGTTANCREGGAGTADNAPAPTSSAFGLQRLNGGCFDSNRSRFDFVNVQNLVPHNSMSAFATCGAATDLSIAVTGGVCPTTVGSPVSYTFTVTNTFGGASDATVTVSIPAGLSFVSSTPAGTFSMGTLTVALGTLGSGASANVQVDLTAAAAGGHVLTGAVASSVSDPVTLNNSVVSASTFVGSSTASIRAMYSNLASAANSNVPTGVSAASQFFFTTTTSQDIFGRPFASSDGNWLVFKARSNLATTLDDVLVRVNVGGNTASTVAQEGVTDLGGGELVGVLDFEPSVNNSGNFAYSTATSAAAASNDVVVKNIGGTSTVVAREGNSDGFGGTVATSVTSWDIANNGDVFWGHLLSSATANDLEALILDAAVPSIVARSNDVGTTPAPSNQVGGTSFPWKLFNSGSDIGAICQRSPDGAHVLIHGDLEGGTTDPDAVGVDGAIVLMDGQTLGSVPGTVTTISGVTLRGADWIGYGVNNTGDDWVVHNGTVVAATGQPITPGSTEVWGDSSFANTFFLAVNNANGDYIIGGVTSADDDNANAVFVLNGTTVIVRENDAIDLDGDGVFNDDAYLRTFRDDRAYLTDDRQLYFCLETRNAAGYCAGNAKTADAIARLQLPGGSGACCCGSTCTVTSAAGCTGTNTSFSGTGTVCNTGGSTTTPCCLADFNHAGGITVQDIFDFLAGYFGSNGCADINGGGISVQDIFDFLAAYFAGGC